MCLQSNSLFPLSLKDDPLSRSFSPNDSNLKRLARSNIFFVQPFTQSTFYVVVVVSFFITHGLVVHRADTRFNWKWFSRILWFIHYFLPGFTHLTFLQYFLWFVFLVLILTFCFQAFSVAKVDDYSGAFLPTRPWAEWSPSVDSDTASQCKEEDDQLHADQVNTKLTNIYI